MHLAVSRSLEAQTCSSKEPQPLSDGADVIEVQIAHSFERSRVFHQSDEVLLSGIQPRSLADKKNGQASTRLEDSVPEVAVQGPGIVGKMLDVASQRAFSPCHLPPIYRRLEVRFDAADGVDGSQQTARKQVIEDLHLLCTNWSVC